MIKHSSECANVLIHCRFKYKGGPLIRLEPIFTTYSGKDRIHLVFTGISGKDRLHPVL